MKQWYKTVCIFFLAGCSVQKGNAQTHYGTGAGTQGAFHSFFGNDAGNINTGDNNTFIGTESGLFNTTGFENTYIGTLSGRLNQGGNKNFFGGFAAGFSNATGGKNTFLGWGTGYLNKTGAYNTFIGSESGYSNETAIANAFLGGQSGYSNTNGSNNAFFGYGAGYGNTVGEKNTYLGYGSGGGSTLINATAIGALAKVTSNNSLVLGKNANVGIGISAPGYQLQLSTSSAAKLGSPSWTIWSDKRLKKDISDFTDGLAQLKQIRPVWFSYNGEAGIKIDKKFVGVIAQDMQLIAPYTIGSSVYQDSLGNQTEYLDYDANAVTYILINAVKEQQEIIDQKETKIQDLAERLEKVEMALASARIGSENTIDVGNEGGGSILEQNAPNGFSQETSIKYFIPQSVKKAVVNIYSVNGAKVGSYNVSERGEGVLKLSASEFRSGVFIYDLITDGKSNGAKKMVVTE